MSFPSSMCFHVSFRVSLLASIGNPGGVLAVLALNLEISFWFGGELTSLPH